MAAHVNYKIANWNVNGLQQHVQELNSFINNQNIDRYFFSCYRKPRQIVTLPSVEKYKIYHIRLTDDKASAGTAIIIRDSIKHHK